VSFDGQNARLIECVDLFIPAASRTRLLHQPRLLYGQVC
jgi:hypothetical protein